MMKQFLERLLENIPNYYWTENGRLMDAVSRLGLESEATVLMEVSEDNQYITAHITKGTNGTFTTLAPQTYSMHSDMGNLMYTVVDASRRHLVDIAARGISQLDNADALVRNSENIINQHF